MKSNHNAVNGKKVVSISKLIKTGITHIILITVAIFWIYPFVWMVASSFKSQDEFFANKLKLIPQDPTFDNIKRIWTANNFDTYFINTVIVTFFAVFMVLIMTATAGYVFGRFKFFGRKFMMGMFVASISIPLVSTMIPVYEIVRGMNLVGTRTGLILASAGGSHVIFLMLYSSYFQQLPNELEEAAKMDGCGFFRIFTSIMFPLSKPIGTTVLIMESVWTWNDFLRPLILTLNNPASRTLAVGLYAFKGENTVDWTGIAAGGFISLVPVVVLFIFLQRYFVDGVAGAVKS